MININKAIEIFESKSSDDDIVEAYEYESFYYFKLKPKSLNNEEDYDLCFFRIDKKNGNCTYLNFVELLDDDIDVKMKPVPIEK